MEVHEAMISTLHGMSHEGMLDTSVELMGLAGGGVVTLPAVSMLQCSKCLSDYRSDLILHVLKCVLAVRRCGSVILAITYAFPV